jgi:hypothetical protein
MLAFDVFWNRRRLHWHRCEDTPWRQEAILLERVLVAGKPQLRIVCRIASYDEARQDEIDERENFWRAASARLGKFFRLSGRDIEAIEKELQKRVPKPAAPTITAAAKPPKP